MAQQPLPDFTQASNELQVQFQRMNNLPGVQLAQIANQLTQLTQTVARLDQAIVRLDTKLDTKFDISNTNSMARLQNTYAISPDDALTALVNLTTGAFIPGFPENSASITSFNPTQLRAILRELGQATPNNQAGGVALLRRQLRVQVGLRGEQTQRA